MAMKARYTVIDGVVVAQKRNGARSLYVPDPLGSTVALLDSTQAQTDTFSYWPYGENNVRTGTAATPFQFVGAQGYYRDSGSRTYVRARTLDTQKGRWMTKDPVGFDGGDPNLYRYACNRIIDLSDRSGTGPLFNFPLVCFMATWPEYCGWQFQHQVDGSKCLDCCTRQHDARVSDCSQGGLGKDRLNQSEYDFCMAKAHLDGQACVRACTKNRKPYHDPTFDLPIRRSSNLPSRQRV